MMQVAARTRLGRCREWNEDTFAIGLMGARGMLGPRDVVSANLPDACVLAVYDGCGGAGPGDVASHLAARIVHLAFTDKPAPGSVEELDDALRAAVEAGGRAVFRSSSDNPAHRGMGTTVTVAAVLEQELRIANVGDARGYLLRCDRIIQLTRDDTLVNDLLESGELRPDEVPTFAHKNVITRAVGVRESVKVTLSSTHLLDGDVLLLCTDGIHRMIDDPTIQMILRSNHEPDEACDALIAASEDAGGHDNETAIVARYAIQE
jgi:PPM family protein phosphatase